MNTEHLAKLNAKAHSSYVTQIDLRDLAFLCQAALDLRMLVDAVRLQAAKVTICDEGSAFLDLVSEVRVIEGDLPL